MRPGDLVKFVGVVRPLRGRGAWALQHHPGGVVDQAWLPSDAPPGIYLGRPREPRGRAALDRRRVHVGSGITQICDAEVLVNGQVYLVPAGNIERAREPVK